MAIALISFGGLAAERSNAAAPKLSQGDRLWFQCRACHTLKKNEPHKLGPNLHGFINAKAATRPGFKYSKALTTSGIVWNDAELDQWIKKPNDLLKGHRMNYAGMTDASKRALLIKYLKEKTR
ncbi:c-type cytochrome [Sphingorhabdus sp. 109]|jgi:cytochrome c|uniref:c-type cytochrome n=2 Tax=Sphingomonadaceae TaxID=41297 RepID=UPI0013569ABF|nr:cytochrome C [Sphingorhabdus sp. 109]